MMILGAFALGACNSNPTASSNAPSDHTISQDGVLHKPGLNDPTNNCISCHGTDLRGGDGPSCYSCHDKKW